MTDQTTPQRPPGLVPVAIEEANPGDYAMICWHESTYELHPLDDEGEQQDDGSVSLHADRKHFSAAGEYLYRDGGETNPNLPVRIVAAYRLESALDEIESLRKQVAERDATIAELRAALESAAARLVEISDLHPQAERDAIRAMQDADAILAKTAPKEGT